MSEFFVRPHYRRNGHGKEGFEQRSWTESMQRAKDLEEPVIALEAEMMRLWWEAGGKKELSVPFEFRNEELFKYGVTKKTKLSYLKRLEAAKWVKIEWRDGREPIIQLLRSF